MDFFPDRGRSGLIDDMRSPSGTTFGLVLLLAAPAAAHPLADVRYDRTVAVGFDPAGVVVRYTLEANPLAVHLHAAQILTPGEIQQLDTTERGFLAAYAKKLAPEIAGQLVATADGAPLAFRVEKLEVDVVEHPRFRFTLRADWPPGGPKRAFALEDETFDDTAGALNLTLDRGGLAFDVREEPPAALRTRPAIDLKPEERRRLRRASAVVEPPAPAPVVPAAGPPDVVVTSPERPGLVADLFQRGVVAILDSDAGIGLLLFATFLFGAGHAFTPGHGKTLVAAYLVGERGTVSHAVLLAVTTTVAHTGSVILLAAVLLAKYGNNVPGTTQGVVQFVGGLLVAAVGLWLLMRRLSGGADHVHLFGDHHHDHAHHPGPPANAGTLRLVLMGLGGGIIPCWDAILILIPFMAMSRLGTGVALLVSFSAGLGLVLVALGVSVVYAHRAGGSRFGESRWFKLLPLLSAVFLIAVGLWLAAAGLRGAG
jgi:ABC-type nickel/cobalt efflux system permease component RcnA